MTTLLPPASGSKVKLFIPKITGGKRGPSGPIATTSDEEEAGDSGKEEATRGKEIQEEETRSVTSPLMSPLSPAESVDYDNVSSPGNSSTASGPIYVRQPGFTHHAHEIAKPRIKKKKTASTLLNIREGLNCKGANQSLPIRVKPKKDPLPMRLRALPQSFWQQPNVSNYVSPATLFPTLPPLRIIETDEDVTEVRPITPPDDSVKCKKTPSRPTPCSERKLTMANTDLLFKLFEGINGEKLSRKSTTNTQFRRGRPRKPIMATSSKQGLLLGNDPHLGDDVSEKMFPHLGLEHGRQTSYSSGHSSLHLITVKEGDKSVTLPALSIDQNYSQMLSELVMHI